MPHQSAGRQGLRRIRCHRRPALRRQWCDGCAERARHQDAPHTADADESLAGDPGRESSGGVIRLCYSGMRLRSAIADLRRQARNPYSRWWLWIPGSFASLMPGMTSYFARLFYSIILPGPASGPTGEGPRDRPPFRIPADYARDIADAARMPDRSPRAGP